MSARSTGWRTRRSPAPRAPRRRAFSDSALRPTAPPSRELGTRAELEAAGDLLDAHRAPGLGVVGRERVDRLAHGGGLLDAQHSFRRPAAAPPPRRKSSASMRVTSGTPGSFRIVGRRRRWRPPPRDRRARPRAAPGRSRMRRVGRCRVAVAHASIIGRRASDETLPASRSLHRVPGEGRGGASGVLALGDGRLREAPPPRARDADHGSPDAFTRASP